MKRMTSLLLAIVMTGSMLLTIFAGEEQVNANSGKTALSGRLFGETIDLGPQAYTASSASVIDAVIGVENGRAVIYTTASTHNAVFNVVDIEHNELIFSAAMAGVQQVWRHSLAPNGDVYIATVSVKNGSNAGELWRYSPANRKIVNLGEPLPGEKSLWSMTVAPDGMVYGGSFQGGKVFGYNPDTNQFRDYGQMVAGQQYVRSIAYYEGYLYAGIGSTGDIIKLDVVSGEKKSIFAPVPDILGLEPSKVPFVYSMAVVDHYLLAKLEGEGRMDLLYYDLDTGVWSNQVLGKIDQPPLKNNGVFNFNQLEAKDGKVYIPANGYITAIDLATKEAAATSIAYGSSLRGAAWIEFADQEQFPGESLVTMQSNGKITIMNLQNNKRTDFDNVVLGGPIPRHNLENGPDGKLYMSGYPGGIGAAFDPLTNTTEMFPQGQAEGMVSDGSYMYFGVYPHAELYKMDTSKPGYAISKIGEIGSDQDRPYIMKNFNGKLYIGTIAGYGKLSGALTIYDPATEQKEVFTDVVHNQGIIGLAEKDGKLFGSTTIVPGLGTDATEKNAKIFVWDIANKKKITEFTLNLPGSEQFKLISGLTIGADGLLWGTVDGYVFAINTDTYEIEKYKNIYTDKRNYGMWRPIHTRWGEDGLLYTDLGGRVTVIDTKTMKHATLTPLTSEVKFMTLGKDASGAENIYYLMDEATNLLMISVTEAPYTPKMKAIEHVYTQNTSFETDPLGNWNPFGTIGSGVTIGRSTERSHTGIASLKMEDTSRSVGGQFTTYPINILPDKEYTLSMWHYVSDGASSDDAIAVFNIYNGGSSPEQAARIDVTDRGKTKQWIKESVTFTTNSGAKTARIMPMTSNYNLFTAYYDDVTLTIDTSADKLPGELGLGEIVDQMDNGSNIRIPVTVKDAKELSRVQSIIQYDPSIFEFVRLTPTEQFANGKDMITNVHTDVPGKVDFVVGYKSMAESYTGLDSDDKLEVAVLELKAKKSKKSTEIKLQAGSELTGKGQKYGGLLNEDIAIELAVVPSAPLVTVAQPVTNYSFEQISENGDITGWSNHYPNGGIVFTVSNEKSYSGKNSLKIVDQSASQSGGYLSYPHPIIGGQDYRADMMINIADGKASDDSIAILYFYKPGSSDPIATEHIKVSPIDREIKNEWTKQGVSFTSPDDATTMRFMLYTSNFNQFTAYYDDITLKTGKETNNTTGYLELTADALSVLTGEEIEVTVYAKDVNGLTRATGSIQYDSGLLELAAFEPANNFSEDIPVYTDQSGIIRFAMKQSSTSSLDGEVAIAKAVLRAKTAMAGSASVRLLPGAELTTANFSPYAAVSDKTEELSIKVGFALFTKEELMAAVKQIGAPLTTDNSKFDINKDGKIDIADIALIYLNIVD